jgi:hypothetical protein
MKGFLRMLWNPNDPTKGSAEADDLEVFYDDHDFKNLLGQLQPLAKNKSAIADSSNTNLHFRETPAQGGYSCKRL